MGQQASYWDHIETAFEEVDIYESYDVFRAGASQFPEWQIDLFAAHWTLSEVLNGGLVQYFGNSTAVLASEAVRGFARMGALEVAAALEGAMKRLGEPYPVEHAERTQRLATLTGKPADSGTGQTFSFIPKWVRDSAGITPKGKSDGPFAMSDHEFTPREDALYAAMDRYAELHSAG